MPQSSSRFPGKFFLALTKFFFVRSLNIARGVLRPSDGSKKAAIDARLCEWLEQIPWIVTITNSAVLISLVWLVHYLGFFLLVGKTAIVDLRVLGVAARNQKLAPLAGQLFPFAWTGLGLVIASGFIMF